MSTLRRWLRRLTTTFGSGRAERELNREVASHLALIEDDFRRRGLSADEARAAARRAFGGVEQTKERQRDARSFMLFDQLKQDVALRAALDAPCARLRGGRDPDARARHRREHRSLQPARRRSSSKSLPVREPGARVLPRARHGYDAQLERELSAASNDIAPA